METKHTPGPWTLVGGKHRMWICRVGNNSNDPDIWSEHKNVVGEPWPFGDKFADAQLIASAPTMLAALKQIENYLEKWADEPECGKFYGLAVNAIAEAEGR